MALIKCPECVLQVSDKALACPHCGFPLQNTSKAIRTSRQPKKRRRLPNGFGSITELKSRNLRKPFLARITTGRTPLGKPILKIFGYFETYEKAYTALVEYQQNPYDLDSDITVSALFEKWTDEYFPTLKSDSSIRTITSAWLYCSSIYNMRAKDVRARHMKGCMEDGFRIGTKGKEKDQIIKATANVKSRIKSMFNLMWDYALEYEIVNMNYARTFEISGDIIKEREEQKRAHIIMTKEEMNILWNNVDIVKFVDWVLIQCYMGWRPQELVTLLLEEVNLDDDYIIGGMKTEAGKQRMVPIHSEISHLIKKNYDLAISLNSKYLFNDPTSNRGGIHVTYDKYVVRYNKVIETLNLNPEHRPHDPRNTFITMGKKSKMDEYALKLIVGHNIKDITESVYTKRDLEWLRKDIEKISCNVLI